jgi:hypothetical protein
MKMKSFAILFLMMLASSAVQAAPRLEATQRAHTTPHVAPASPNATWGWVAELINKIREHRAH